MPKNKAAQSLGRKGGKARASKLTKEQRRAIAKKAGIASGAKRSKKRKHTWLDRPLDRTEKCAAMEKLSFELHPGQSLNIGKFKVHNGEKSKRFTITIETDDVMPEDYLLF